MTAKLYVSTPCRGILTPINSREASMAIAIKMAQEHDVHILVSSSQVSSAELWLVTPALCSRYCLA